MGTKRFALSQSHIYFILMYFILDAENKERSFISSPTLNRRAVPLQKLEQIILYIMLNADDWRKRITIKQQIAANS